MAKTIINENQIGLLIRNGRIDRTLRTGAYKTYSFRNEQILIYPTYSQSYTFSLFVRTKESAQITVDITVGITVTDPKKLYLSGKSAYEFVNQAITSQLQEIAAIKTLPELLESDLHIYKARLNSDISNSGLTATIELTPQIRLPRNLQNAIDAQEVARQRAKAELEEARGRSAVIRHYANVAKVTKENPDLLRLLLGQKAKSINVAFDASAKSPK